MPFLVDLATKARLRREQEEEERERQEREKRTLGGVRNLFSLVGQKGAGESLARFKEQADLVALDRKFGEIVQFGVPLKRGTFADYLTEYNDPGHLKRSFAAAQTMPAMQNPEWAQAVSNRFESLSDIARHQNVVGGLPDEGYWRLIKAAEDGEEPQAIRHPLGIAEPSGVGPGDVFGAIGGAIKEGAGAAVGGIERGVEEVAEAGKGFLEGLQAGAPGTTSPFVQDVLEQRARGIADAQQQKVLGQSPSTGEPYRGMVRVVSGQTAMALSPLTGTVEAYDQDVILPLAAWTWRMSNTKPTSKGGVFHPNMPGDPEDIEDFLALPRWLQEVWKGGVDVALTAPFPFVGLGSDFFSTAGRRGAPIAAGVREAAEEAAGRGELTLTRKVGQEAAEAGPTKAVAVAEERLATARARLAELLAKPEDKRKGIEAVQDSVQRLEQELVEARKAPVSTGPPTPEELSTGLRRQEAVGRLTEIINAAKPVRVEAAELLHQKRVQEAGAIHGVLEKGRAGGYEPGKVGLIARGQTAGEVAVPVFEPPIVDLSPRQITDLHEQVMHHPWGRKLHDYPNADQALRKVLNGEIPTFSELRLLEKVFGPKLGKAVLQQRKWSQKALQNFWEATNIPRALLATADFSATLRQAAVFAPRHPKEVFGNIWNAQIRPFFSERLAREMDEAAEIVPDALWHDHAIAGHNNLFIAKRGGALTEREEVWISRLLQKIPVVGHVVRASERAYVTYLNKVRRDVYTNIVRKWQGQAKSANDYLSMADAVNLGSGRGRLIGGKKAEEALGPFLSTLFWAPRFVLSRFQYPLKLFGKSNAVRFMVAQELGSFMAAGTTFLAFLKYSGLADVELDPRSTDFGKVRIGKTRIDFWGGWQPIARYSFQVATGQRKAGSGFIYGIDKLETIGRFVQGKLSPQAGFAIDVMRNQTFLGEELLPTGAGAGFLEKLKGVKAQAFNRLAPIFVQDVVDAMRQEGMLGGMLAAPGVFGIGVNTYQTPYDRMMYARNEVMGEMRDPATGLPVTEEQRRENPALAARIDADPRVQAVREELDKDVRLHGGSPHARAGMLRREKRSEQISQQEKDDANLDAGNMEHGTWKERANDRAADAFRWIEGVYAGLDITFEDAEDLSHPVAVAIQDYYKVLLEDFTFDDTGERDWDGFFAAREEALAGLSQPERVEALDYINRYRTPKQKEIAKKEEQVGEYFEIPDQVYLVNKDFFGFTAHSFSAYRREVAELAKQEAIRRGYDPENAAQFAFTKDILRAVAPEYARLYKRIDRAREIWRSNNRAKVKILIDLDIKEPSRREAREFATGQSSPWGGLELPSTRIPLP